MNFMIKFDNPLAVSQNNLRDDFKFTIKDKSLFVTKEGFMEMSEQNSQIFVSFPR